MDRSSNKRIVQKRPSLYFKTFDKFLHAVPIGVLPSGSDKFLLKPLGILMLEMVLVRTFHKTYERGLLGNVSQKFTIETYIKVHFKKLQKM